MQDSAYTNAQMDKLNGRAELLAPAGDMNRLKLAVMYGADAVYLGGQYGLRADTGMKEEYMEEAVSYAHSHGKKVYVTVNIFARNKDFDAVKVYVKKLEQIGADAVIVSDLGVLNLVRENTNLDIHISTQANVLNKYTAKEYVKLGAKRIILARECNIAEIKEISEHLKNQCEIEIFVHGSMCVCYSGRCMISNYMMNRDANRGECSQPCRYKYFLVEEKRRSDYWEIEEDANGTYIMNSKELCLINHLDELSAGGVTSFKIEGRRKSEYYVAAAVSAYRRALDKEKFDCLKEIDKVPHRPWTTGFVFDKDDFSASKDALLIEHSRSLSKYDVAAMCLGGEKIVQRNVFCKGDELEILSPGENLNKTFIVNSIKDENGQTVERANKASGVYFLELNFPRNGDTDSEAAAIILKPYEFLRKLTSGG